MKERESEIESGREIKRDIESKRESDGEKVSDSDDGNVRHDLVKKAGQMVGEAVLE